ncbi:MAG: ArsR/SmtB family transcription factor [Bacillota bacterium]
MESNKPEKIDPFICEEWFCDEEKVRQIQRELNSIEGMGLILKALADDTRIKIAYALSKTEMCVCDIARLIDASSNVASYHLRTLNYLGIAKNRKDGKLVYYFITDERIKRLIWDVYEYAQDRKN